MSDEANMSPIFSLICTINLMLEKLLTYTCFFNTIVPQLSKCLKFEAVWGVLTDQMI